MVEPHPSILVVDDRPENLYAMKAILRKLDAEVVCAASGEEALTLSLENDFCLAIVDVQMPEMDGYELVELIRSNANTSALPVIFVSAIYSDEYSYRKGYDAGAVDFLSKPVNADILLSKVRVFIQLWQQKLELHHLVNSLQDWNNYLEKTVRERTETLKTDNAALNNELAFQNALFTTATSELAAALAGLRQSVSRLKSAAKSHSPDQDPLNHILTGEKHIREIVTAMEDAVQAGSGLSNPSRKPALLQDIVAAVCDDCHSLLDERNVTISVENLHNLPPIQVDVALTHLLFRQLILHALHYTPEGGAVRITGEQFPAAYIPQMGRETIRVSIAFQDPGADREYLARVSAIFKGQEIPPASAGSRFGPSLSLNLAHKIVAAHGGLIWAEASGPAEKKPAGMLIRVLLPHAAGSIPQ